MVFSPTMPVIGAMQPIQRFVAWVDVVPCWLWEDSFAAASWEELDAEAELRTDSVSDEANEEGRELTAAAATGTTTSSA